VEYAGELSGYGNCIILNHGGGYYTLYAHAATLFVYQSQQVEKGSVIAEAGGAAQGSSGTMHFEIRKAKKALDPADWLAR
jgi:septal ring factor EnvC (AmiA/AmiB activator)